MNITLTVRGALEEDAALQEIVSILYRKASEARGEIEAGAPEAGDGKTNVFVPTPKRGVPALSGDLAEEPAPQPAPEPAPETQPAPEPPAEPAKPELEFETVRKAAAEAMNRGKRAEVKNILQAHGERLSDIDPAIWPEILEAIEAL